MSTVRDVNAQAFNKALAAHLKRSGKLAVPAWTDIVKTGKGQELGPVDPDWFYFRAAVLARQVYLQPGLGVGYFKYRYGANKNRGTRPSHHVEGSGSVNRKALQALEKLKLITHDGKGRKVTAEGQRELDRIAGLCLGKQ